MTTMLHKGAVSSAFAYCGAIIRYIPLALIITKTKIDSDELKKTLLFHVKIIFSLQITIGIVQIIGGQNIMTFFLPKTDSHSSAQNALLEGDIAGTFSNTIDYAFLILTCYLLILYNTRRSNNAYVLLLSVFTLYIVYETGSLAAIIAFLIIFAIFLCNGHSYRFIYLSIAVMVISIILMYIYNTELYLFIENKKLSRLGMISSTLPNFLLKSNIFDILFGIGTDLGVINKTVLSLPNPPHIFVHYYAPHTLADVYWVAAIVENGIIGFILLLGMLAKIYVLSKLIRQKDWQLYMIMISLLCVILILGFVNQILSVKPFTLFFWILVGILDKVYAKSKIVFS